MPAPEGKDLAALVADVAAKLEQAFAPLSKADGDDPETSGGGSPPGASAAPPASPPSDATGGDPAASPDAPPAPPAGGAPDPAADQGQGVTVESLTSEYASLPLPELQMHLQAAEAAFQQLAGGDPAASAGAPPPGAGAPPPPPAASASPAPGGPPPGMGKSEAQLGYQGLVAQIEGLQKSVGQIGGLRKSLVDLNAMLVARDGELQATKTALAKAQTDMSKMTADTQKVAEGVTRVLARSGTLRKSATRMSDVAVSGKPGSAPAAAPGADVGITAETPRSTVIAHLNKFTREGHRLAKSDSEKLTHFICNGSAPVQPVLEILAKFPSQ